jgi:DMSO/TMAO reductase YedYZ molybdopterin-dependent catalytic subunit
MPSAFIDRQASMMHWRFSLAASVSMTRSIGFARAPFERGGFWEDRGYESYAGI